jgi:RNA polymerase sigma-70 factor, ECF subfamily
LRNPRAEFPRGANFPGVWPKKFLPPAGQSGILRRLFQGPPGPAASGREVILDFPQALTHPAFVGCARQVSVDSPKEITQLLAEVGRGDEAAAGALFEKVYGELRALAKSYLRRERPDHTLQATALVHEAYLRLVGAENADWENRIHFFNVAAQVMRNILVDHARRHGAGKRGAGGRKLSLDEAVSFYSERDLNLVALDDALRELESLHPQQGRIVELRFFGGLKADEVAALLRVSETTVNREWHKAKMWLRSQLVQDR